MGRTDYNKMSKKTHPVDEVVEEYVVAPTEETAEKVAAPAKEPVKEPIPVVGVVSGCTRLNIRKNPNSNSEVLCHADAGAKLMIDLDASTHEWYAVCTETGFDGFCMKAYVIIIE